MLGETITHKVIDGHLHIGGDLSEKDCLQDLFELGGLDGIGIASMPKGIGYDSHHANERALKVKRQYPGRIFVFGGLDYSDIGYRRGEVKLPAQKGGASERNSAVAIRQPGFVPTTPPPAAVGTTPWSPPPFLPVSSHGAPWRRRVDFAEQAETLFAAGADGIKMIEGKPDARKNLGIPLDSPIFDSFYSFMEKHARPILFHVNDPKSFWDRDKIPDWAVTAGWFWGDGDYPSREQLYGEAGGVLKKFPGLRVIFAHFYCMWEDPADIGGVLDQWTNVCVDVTPGTPMYYGFAAAPDTWRPVFEQYQDRLIFGIDNVGTYQGNKQAHLESCLTRMNNVRKFLETDEPVFAGRGLKLDPGILKKIYRDNFMRMVTR